MEVRVMTFLDKQRFVGRTEHEMLKASWEGEIFGVGMMEALAKRYPEHADHATACATMEWFNVHRCEEFGHETVYTSPWSRPRSWDGRARSWCASTRSSPWRS
jgi:hypothetical protein